MKYAVDVAIIGGGPAGLAAAWSARQHGAKKVLVLDRNQWLGGILPQCIHDGFGVEETGSSMTGTEYAEMYIKLSSKAGVETLCETMVLSLSADRHLIAVNKQGIHDIQAKAVVLAMGCRERTRWNVLIPGSRPSGIFTAGVAQAFINLYNIIPGKEVVVLGSGDVGLIMARRLTLEGATVHGIVEIMPFSSGLPRNVIQCLDDYDIPLYLQHTVTEIHGKERVEAVTIAQVDEEWNPIKGSERKVKCDTLLLSLGLIPENELSREAGITLDRITGGPIVTEMLETSISGVFCCGNCLQVYDTVDMLSIDAKHAGKNAALVALGKMKRSQGGASIVSGHGVRYVVPQQVNTSGVVRCLFRVVEPGIKKTLCIKSGNRRVKEKKLSFVNPANMCCVEVDIPKELIDTHSILEVSLA